MRLLPYFAVLLAIASCTKERPRRAPEPAASQAEIAEPTPAPAKTPPAAPATTPTPTAEPSPAAPPAPIPTNVDALRRLARRPLSGGSFECAVALVWKTGATRRAGHAVETSPAACDFAKLVRNAASAATPLPEELGRALDELASDEDIAYAPVPRRRVVPAELPLDTAPRDGCIRVDLFTDRGAKAFSLCDAPGVTNDPQFELHRDLLDWVTALARPRP